MTRFTWFGLALIVAFFAAILVWSFGTESGRQARQQAAGASERPPVYEVVKRETYSASIGGGFVQAPKLHVIATNEAEIVPIAQAIGFEHDAVTVFFWRSREDVGKVPALYGVEYVGGALNDLLVDTRRK